MNIIKFRIDPLKNQISLATLVMLLTCLIVVFSTYMSASFWAQLGATKTACLTFALLGVFLELAKICAGLTIVSAHSFQSSTLKITTLAVFAIFTMTSFITSVGTIAHELKIGKTTAFNNNIEVKFINSAIATQEQIIASLLQSQQADTTHGYRSRANATLAQIKQAQSDLEVLQNKLHNTKINDVTVSNVIVIFNALISLGEDQWERALTVILGALTEITSLFLLYLNFALKNARLSEKQIAIKSSSTLKPMTDDLPISSCEYQQITKQIIARKVMPTQRELKKVLRLGNEKIAKIFSKWVNDQVLIRDGKSYRLYAAGS